MYVNTKRKDVKVLLRNKEIMIARVAAAVDKKQTG